MGRSRVLELFVVRLERGGPWDWERDMRDQDGWDEHARFMDDLVASGFIILGGPLDNGRETLHVVAAASEESVRERFAADPWAANGMLRPKSVEGWTILLDGLSTLEHEGRVDLVRVAIAQNELAAAEIRALLQTEGIESVERKTDFGVGTTDGSAFGSGAREVLVNPQDLDAARALIEEPG